jgi:carboxypeptidase Q
MIRTAVVVALALAAGPACGRPGAPPSRAAAWVGDTTLRVPSRPPADALAGAILAEYGAVADRIRAHALADDGAYQKLRELTDDIGARLSGSPALERAVRWAEATMRADGHVVVTEPVMVPHWVRDAERAELIAPRRMPLPVLGLGGTVPTPPGGIEAPVVVVRSWQELEARRAEVAGAIVLYDVALPPYSPTTGDGYGQVVGYRWSGPAAASKLGAVGVLMRSVTARSLRTLHTGGHGFPDGVVRIPAAAITTEDSALLARLAAGGTPPRVRLELASRQLADAESANVLGELRGRQWPDEVVVIGAHLDSWDVGQGAHDDGAGCVVMMQALTTLRQLGLVPRRTIRVVLYTNEENGGRGGKAYAERRAGELDQHVLALESDFGGFAARGFSVDADHPARDRLVGQLGAITQLLAPIGASDVRIGYSGSDIRPLLPAGVPAIGLLVDGATYFDVHHTEADTLDKVDPADLRSQVVAVATLAYVVADRVERLGGPR